LKGSKKATQKRLFIFVYFLLSSFGLYVYVYVCICHISIHYGDEFFYFGIVLLSTCTQTNWFVNVGTGTHVQTWHLKFDATGTIRFIGNYKRVVSALAKFVQSFLDNKIYLMCTLTLITNKL